MTSVLSLLMLKYGPELNALKSVWRDTMPHTRQRAPREWCRHGAFVKSTVVYHGERCPVATLRDSTVHPADT
jgi:hypothetical protein